MPDELARKRALGERMKHLRENSPYTQRAIADALGLELRSYQKAEKTGGMSYERLVKLADLHAADLGWLLRGEDGTLTRSQAIELLEGLDAKATLILRWVESQADGLFRREARELLERDPRGDQPRAAKSRQGRRRQAG